MRLSCDLHLLAFSHLALLLFLLSCHLHLLSFYHLALFLFFLFHNLRLLVSRRVLPSKLLGLVPLSDLFHYVPLLYVFQDSLSLQGPLHVYLVVVCHPPLLWVHSLFVLWLGFWSSLPPIWF